jgi:Ca2+-binding RTX toxin-like protein
VARAHIHGDDHRNVLVTTGCPARFDGAGGPDVLVYNRDGNCRGVFKGGPGRDRLIGGTGNDRLTGGRGNDFANGWTGNDDVCRVEVKKNCDR